MERINPSTLRPVRMTARGLVFQDEKGVEYFGARRVANAILAGQQYVFCEKTLEDRKLPYEYFLLTPSAF